MAALEPTQRRNDLTSTASPRSPARSDKRERILRAALSSISRLGLHNTPMAAIAREAGVAKGTPYLYFASKEALINALYVELLHERRRSFDPEGSMAEDPRERLWASWSRHARWHLRNPDAVNFLQQCEASGILADASVAEQQRLDWDGLKEYAGAVEARIFRDLPVQVFFALFAGPLVMLERMQAKKELEVTEEVLRTTFEGVARSVLPADS